MRKGNNTMRVVFFSAARQVWGAEVSLLTLASALTDQGVDVVVVCPSGELADRAVEAGIATVHAVPPVADSVTQGRMRDSQRLWQTCLRIARRQHRDNSVEVDVVVETYAYHVCVIRHFAPAL